MPGRLHRAGLARRTEGRRVLFAEIPRLHDRRRPLQLFGRALLGETHPSPPGQDRPRAGPRGRGEGDCGRCGRRGELEQRDIADVRSAVKAGAGDHPRDARDAPPFAGQVEVHAPCHDFVARSFVEGSCLHALRAVARRQNEVRCDDRPGALLHFVAVVIDDEGHPGKPPRFGALASDHCTTSAEERRCTIARARRTGGGQDEEDREQHQAGGNLLRRSEPRETFSQPACFPGAPGQLRQESSGG